MLACTCMYTRSMPSYVCEAGGCEMFEICRSVFMSVCEHLRIIFVKFGERIWLVLWTVNYILRVATKLVDVCFLSVLTPTTEVGVISDGRRTSLEYENCRVTFKWLWRPSEFCCIFGRIVLKWLNGSNRLWNYVYAWSGLHYIRRCLFNRNNFTNQKAPQGGCGHCRQHAQLR